MTKKTIILVGFILLKFFLQYILLSPQYDLQRDEYLHLDQANHLAWGYLSVPPLTSWVSLVISLLGNGVFWIKFFPALYGALTILIVWKTIETLKGNLFALVLGATCVLFSVLLRLNTLYQPNSLDVLAWTALYFTILKYFVSGRQKWLYMGALVFAIGFLNKYNILFLIAGFLPALLISNQRPLLFKKYFYLACLLGALLVLPNILWQVHNNFPVVHHMKELARTQLINVDRGIFLRSQIIFFLGGIPVIFSCIYALLFYPPFKKFRLFFWALIFTLVVFMSLRAKDYYAIGLYPVYIAFGAVFLADILKTGWRRYLRPILLLLPVLYFIAMFNLAFPNKPVSFILANQQHYKELGLLRWEDGKDHELPQDFADMLGWKELAARTDSIYAALAGTGETLVLCDNYGQAGAINYYTKKGIKAISFDGDYINWINTDKQYRNFIRIKNRDGAYAEIEKTGLYFIKSFAADSIRNHFSREYGTTIFAFQEAKVDITKRIKKEIIERKNNWGF